MKSANEVAQITPKEQFAERGVPLRRDKTKCQEPPTPRPAGATQTRSRSSQRISRSPFQTFPLREGRDDERKVLGLSRPENPEAHFPLSLDSAVERRRS